jgi:GNAT superfamily N-acetyltransferase
MQHIRFVHFSLRWRAAAVKSGTITTQFRNQGHLNMAVKAPKKPLQKSSASVASHGAHDHEHVHGPDCNHGPHMICEMHIRSYKSADFRQLTEIWRACDIKLDETDTAKALSQNMKRKNSYNIFVAEAKFSEEHTKRAIGKPRLAGGIVVTFDGHRAYIYHFAVQEDFRGVGLGRALLETCEAQAKKWGAKHMRLSARTDPSRAVAHRIYETSGWTPDKTIWTYAKTLR